MLQWMCTDGDIDLSLVKKILTLIAGAGDNTDVD